MKFPFRDFWSRLIVKFGEFTYKSLVGTILVNQGLRVESEDNNLLGDTTSVDGRTTR
jgi:hypothetical protein